ncbi:MAG: hypothetical protein AB1656_09215 [Candidatus Omnitrophota bacterium]
MKIKFGLALLISIGCVCAPAWTATSNTGNNPAFLIMDIVSNTYANMSPNTLDVGVDIGADGTYDYWMSEDPFQVKIDNVKGTSSQVAPDAWRTVIVNLDRYAGQKAKIKIVDNSDKSFIAVNSIRLNFADGKMVENGVPNGFFEDAAALAHWTVNGSLSAADLLKTDAGLNNTAYGTHFIQTTIAGTATLESEAFELTPISSFIYGVFGGPASSHFDKAGAYGDSDNGIMVYVDLGTASSDPNGKYVEGEDIPLYGFLFRGPDDAMESAIINTTGYEGRRAQFVVADLSEAKAVSFDAIRLNWDNQAIRNGGFEEGFETGVPDGFDGTNVRGLAEYPGGKVPGWTQNHITVAGKNFDAQSTFTFFGMPAGSYTKSGYVWVGSGSFDFGSSDAGTQAGIELRSDVFTIQSLPSADSSVFMSFNSGQASSRIEQFGVDSQDWTRSAVQLHVDMDGDGAFDGANDFIYSNQNQGISWAGELKGEVDVWHYPEYRFYIGGEQQGKQAYIYVEETMTGGWAWMAVDDFYFWNGTEAALAFPNSDFEMGDMTNWTEELLTNGFPSWLASNAPTGNPADPALHTALNNISSWVDGNWSADSAPNELGDGDNQRGRLWSHNFTIPSLKISNVGDWSVYGE